jgi:CHAT domain-containing protein
MTKRKRPAPTTASGQRATPARKPVTILFFAANPVDTDELRLDKEAREIETRISSATFRDCFEVRTRWAARPTDLLDAINDHRPGLVHFSGHGAVAGIVLESTAGSSHEVGVDALSRMFATVKDDVRCVLLNACSTEQHAVAISEHVEAAIGMAASIADVAAAVFAAAFYRGLASGRNVVSAYEQGIAAMMVEGTGDDHVPKIHARPGADLERLVFATQAR